MHAKPSFALALSLILLAVLASPCSAARTFARAGEPVELSMSNPNLSELLGLSTSSIRLVAWTGSEWQLVPFQVDERNSSGVYVTFEDGVLDENDEIFFYSAASYLAPPGSWWNETFDRRKLITIYDPLSGTTSYVYLYYTTEPVEAPEFPDDVVYQAWVHAIDTPSYYAIVRPDKGYVEILKAKQGQTILGDLVQKLGGWAVTAYGSEVEDDDVDYDTTITLLKDGPLRVITKTNIYYSSWLVDVQLTRLTKIYRRSMLSQVELYVSVDLDDMTVLCNHEPAAAPLEFENQAGDYAVIDGNGEQEVPDQENSWFCVYCGNGSYTLIMDYGDLPPYRGFAYDDYAPENHYGRLGFKAYYLDAGTYSFSSYLVVHGPQSNSTFAQEDYERYANPLSVFVQSGESVVPEFRNLLALLPAVALAAVATSAKRLKHS